MENFIFNSIITGKELNIFHNEYINNITNKYSLKNVNDLLNNK